MEETIEKLTGIGCVNESTVEEFEALVQELSEGSRREAIAPLLAQLDDGCEFDEVMFTVIHVVESFPWSDYCSVLSEHLAEILARSPRWGRILVTRIMNSKDEWPEFLAELSRRDDIVKRQATELIRRLAEDEQFRTQSEQGLRVLEG